MQQKLIKTLSSILIFITLSFSVQINAQLSIDSIIEYHLKATGLLNPYEGIKDFSIEGKLMQNNIGFPIAIKGILPDKLRMDMVFKEQTFIKISNGITVWEYIPMNDSLSTGKCEKNEAQSFIGRLCGSLANYKSGNATARLLETTTLDDIDVYKLEFKYEGQSQIYFIDMYTFLILRIDDDFVENKITYYSDYKKTGKYIIPYSLTGYENGMPVMSMKFNSIKINTGFDTKVFSKPKQ